MRLLLLFFLLFVLTFISNAQDKAIRKIVQQTSREQITKDLYYLSDAKLKGRFLGSPGDSMAAAYIAESFRSNNIVAPYNNGSSYIHCNRYRRKWMY